MSTTPSPNSLTSLYDLPLIEDIPLEQTPWMDIVKVTAKSNRTLAGDLHGHYNHNLRPASRHVATLCRQVEESAVQRAQGAKEHNARVEAQRERQKSQRDAEVRQERGALQALEADLARAHREAAHRVALAGKFYNPQHPDPECVLYHEEESLEALAAELKLPWTPDDDKARLGKVLVTLVTLGTGMLFGISLGLMFHFLAPDTLRRQWPVTLSCALAGILVAYAVAEGVRMFFKAVGERYWLGRPAGSWAPLLVGALLFCTVIIGIESYVEQHGLMAMVSQEDAMRALSEGTPRSSTPSWPYFFAGMFLSLPYVGMNAWHGYLLGRRGACHNRLIAERERRYALVDSSTRGNMEVQQALQAISYVQNLLRAREQIEAEGVMAHEQFESQMRRLDCERRDEAMALNEEEKALLHEAKTHYRNEYSKWSTLLESAKRYWSYDPAHSGNGTAGNGTGSNGTGINGGSVPTVPVLSQASSNRRPTSSGI